MRQNGLLFEKQNLIECAKPTVVFSESSLLFVELIIKTFLLNTYSVDGFHFQVLLYSYFTILPKLRYHAA